MVVSMRPIRNRSVSEAVLITSRFPLAHRRPVHLGNPEAIGILDIEKPAFGDPVHVAGDEIPVFWACGVTPRVVLENSRIPFAVMHHPGRMFVTDLADGEIRDKEILGDTKDREL